MGKLERLAAKNGIRLEHKGAIADRMNSTESAMCIAFVALAENETLDDVTAEEHYNLFAEWASGVTFKAGSIRRRGDDLYRCIQPHTSMTGWEPENVPAIWRHIGNPADEWPEWSPPICAADAYESGDKVSHTAKRWISTVDGNVWEPGVYGWEEAIMN